MDNQRFIIGDEYKPEFAPPIILNKSESQCFPFEYPTKGLMENILGDTKCNTGIYYSNVLSIIHLKPIFIDLSSDMPTTY
jgi:hypothetical protein